MMTEVTVPQVSDTITVEATAKVMETIIYQIVMMMRTEESGEIIEIEGEY